MVVRILYHSQSNYYKIANYIILLYYPNYIILMYCIHVSYSIYILFFSLGWHSDRFRSMSRI